MAKARAIPSSMLAFRQAIYTSLAAIAQKSSLVNTGSLVVLRLFFTGFLRLRVVAMA
jgi:hypothetical protein